MRINYRWSPILAFSLKKCDMLNMQHESVLEGNFVHFYHQALGSTGKVPFPLSVMVVSPSPREKGREQVCEWQGFLLHWLFHNWLVPVISAANAHPQQPTHLDNPYKPSIQRTIFSKGINLLTWKHFVCLFVCFSPTYSLNPFTIYRTCCPWKLWLIPHLFPEDIPIIYPNDKLSWTVKSYLRGKI